MKKTLFALGTLVVTLLAAVSPSHSASYTYTPYPLDIGDFEHSKWYTWGTSLGNIPDYEAITGATLTISSINDWTTENDVLFIWLLDDPALGVKSWADDQAAMVDNVALKYSLTGTKIAQYSDGSSRAETLVFDLFNAGITGTSFPAVYPDLEGAFLAYASDGLIGFGFDPDCHYYNSGVKLEVTTARIPEPSSLLLLGMGLVGLAGFRKKARA